MEKMNEKMTPHQKETCAVINMRNTVELIAIDYNISYEEAMLKFTNSCVYEALFDFETGIWKEGSEYILSLYERYGSKELPDK